MRDVCLVVPCYNEARRLPGDTFVDFVRSRPNMSVVFVNDGSDDDTEKRLAELIARDKEHLLARSLARNSGKAEAVRQGALHAASLGTFGFIGYWDADLSTPLPEVDRLLRTLERHPDCGIALGSRVKRLGSSIERNTTRHYLGRVFSTMASQLLDLPVYDSQCGAKLLRAPLAAALFADRFVTRWLFDVELLVRLRNHLGPEKFSSAAIEVPLTAWKEVGDSRLSLIQMLKVPFELLRIRSRYLR
jgi:dolichyl-phosphate beta-glucosyltransferase